MTFGADAIVGIINAGVQITAATFQLAGTITSAVMTGKKMEWEKEMLKLQISADAGARADELAALNRQGEIQLELQRQQSDLFIKNLKAQGDAQLKAYIDNPQIGEVCAKQYDATGTVSPTCFKADITPEVIKAKKEYDAQRNYKLAITGVIVLVAIIFIVAKYKNKLR